MENFNIFSSIDRTDTVCIIAHNDPDTDALTSLVLLKDFLKRTLHIKTVDIFSQYTTMPDVYLPIVKRSNLNSEITSDYDVAIAVDSSNIDRLGRYSDLFKKAKKSIVIDHHLTNVGYGQYNIIELASSTCEIIFNLLNSFGHKFSKQNYGMIYAGIITDTNNFTVGNLTPSAYVVASECAAHIDPRPIYKQFMNNHTLKNMQLLSLAINNIVTHSNERIILTHISISDASRYLSCDEDYLGLVNRIAAISECDLVCFIYPKGDHYYVSMRASENYSVSDVAKKYGGGGHRGAAAFETDLSPNEIKEFILKDFEKILENSKERKTFKF